MYIKQNRKIIKVISIAVICLFLWDQLAWACPPQSNTLRPLATAKFQTDLDQHSDPSFRIPPPKERLPVVIKLMEECGLSAGITAKQRRSIAKRLAQRYFKLVVTKEELRDLLLAFKESQKPISKLERFLQEKILDYFLERATKIADEVKNGTEAERKEVHELFMAGVRVYKFRLTRYRIRDRKMLLAKFLVLHIHLPEIGLGSIVRRDEARRLMIKKILKSRDIMIFQPALEAIIETMARIELIPKPKLRDRLFRAFYHLLEDTQTFPRFAKALVDVFIKAKHNEVQLIELKDQELFSEEARKIIIKLAKEYPSLKEEFITYLLTIRGERKEEISLVQNLLKDLGYNNPNSAKRTAGEKQEGKPHVKSSPGGKDTSKEQLQEEFTVKNVKLAGNRLVVYLRYGARLIVTKRPDGKYDFGIHTFKSLTPGLLEEIKGIVFEQLLERKDEDIRQFVIELRSSQGGGKASGQSSRKSDDEPKGGGTGKFSRIEAKSIAELEEDGTGVKKYEIKLWVKKLGAKKEESVLVRATWREPEEAQKALYDYEKTGIELIDTAIEELLYKNLKKPGAPGIDDFIIEDADFGKDSLLTLADIAGIGVGLAENTLLKKPFRALYKDVADNKILRFHELAHMAYDQGFLTLDMVLSCIPEGEYKRTHYIDVIRDIEILINGKVHEAIKFHYALRALQRYRGVFGNRDRALTDSLRALTHSDYIDSYLQETREIEDEAKRDEKPGSREKAAYKWLEAERRYFRLNRFSKAVMCKQNAARNYFLAYKSYEKDKNYKESRLNLKKAARLYQALQDERQLAKCWSFLGRGYFLSKSHKESAKYFEKSAKLYEKLRMKRDAAIDWARAALSYVMLGNYMKAGDCDKRSAELNVELREPEIAMEHYVYAKINFARADNHEEERECEQKAIDINKGVFDRIRIIKSILNNKSLNHKAVRSLTDLPERLTLVGIKPATERFTASGDIELKSMERIIKGYFKGQIGFLEHPVTIGSVIDGRFRRYCIYDKEQIRKTVERHVTDIFRDIKLTDLDTDEGLQGFMRKVMTRGARRHILLGHPKKDVLDLMRYGRLLSDVGVPLIQVELTDPNKPPYSERLSRSYSDKSLYFIKRFRQAILDYYWDRWGISDKIGFDWISIRRRDRKRRYVERYMAVTALVKLLIDMEPLEEIEVEFDLDLSDSGERQDEDRGQRISEDRKIAVAIANQA